MKKKMMKQILENQIVIMEALRQKSDISILLNIQNTRRLLVDIKKEEKCKVKESHKIKSTRPIYRTNIEKDALSHKSICTAILAQITGNELLLPRGKGLTIHVCIPDFGNLSDDITRYIKKNFYNVSIGRCVFNYNPNIFRNHICTTLSIGVIESNTTNINTFFDVYYYVDEM